MYWFLIGCFLIMVANGQNASYHASGAMRCLDGTLDWIFNSTLKQKVCFGIARLDESMDWNEAQEYCKNSGGQIITATRDEYDFLKQVLSKTKDVSRIPLGIFNENNKWMQIRDGVKSDSGITDIETSSKMEVLRLEFLTGTETISPVPKTDKYNVVVCEHRTSASETMINMECTDGSITLAVNGAAKCYVFHEFENPSVDGSNFETVSDYCKSVDGTLFDPIDAGDVKLMQNIGQAVSGYVSAADVAGKIYGYVGRKLKDKKDIPQTKAGYSYKQVGINFENSQNDKDLCPMLELPGGMIIMKACDTPSDFAPCVKNAEEIQPVQLKDILGTEPVLIRDLKSEPRQKDIEDLSYLGVAPEAKRDANALLSTSFSCLIATALALIIIR